MEFCFVNILHRQANSRRLFFKKIPRYHFFDAFVSGTPPDYFAALHYQTDQDQTP